MALLLVSAAQWARTTKPTFADIQANLERDSYAFVRALDMRLALDTPGFRPGVPQKQLHTANTRSSRVRGHGYVLDEPIASMYSMASSVGSPARRSPVAIVRTLDNSLRQGCLSSSRRSVVLSLATGMAHGRRHLQGLRTRGPA